MFIRWQTYRSKGGSYRGKTTRVRAILSKSASVDGKSRPQYIAFIGSFVAETLDAETRRDFWKAAEERLSIYVHDGDERGKIEAALARRVPPPTAAEEGFRAAFDPDQSRASVPPLDAGARSKP